MPFSAINTYEEEVRQRNERHTLELQLEQAMVVYQRALEEQRLKNWEDAHDSYEKLFAFDVMQSKPATRRNTDPVEGEATNGSDRTTAPTRSAKSLQLGPALRLRAMALKNYAILLVSPKEPPTEDIERALTYLGESLEIVGTDDKEKLVIGSLVQLLWALGHQRGARLGLEMIVQNDDGGPIEPLEVWLNNRDKAALLLSPHNLSWLEALDFAVDTVDKRAAKEPEILKRFNHLKQPAQPLEEELEEDSKTVISLPTQTWAGLISALNDAVAQSSRKYKRKGTKDSYMWSIRDLWSVKFTGILLNREQRTPIPESEPDIVITEIQGDEKPTTPEKFASEAHPTKSDGSTPMPSPSIEHQASPAKRRRTERVTRSASLALPADFGLVDTNFVAQFNGFLSLTTAESDEFMSPAYLFFEPVQAIPAQLMAAAELKDLLSTWDSRESSQFLAESTSLKPQKGGIMTTLRKDSGLVVDESVDSSEEEFDMNDDNGELESRAVDQFVVTHDGCHIQQIRLELACLLLQKLSSGGCTRSFGKLVFGFIDEIEALLWSRRTFLTASQSLAIYELYADQWLQSRSNVNELKTHRWQSVTGVVGGIQQLWIFAFLSQEAADATPDSSIALFEDILTADFIDEPDRFSHLINIPALTHSNAHMQISKFKAAAAFERVMTPAGTDSSQEEDDIKLLEAMLMPQTHPRPEQSSEMEFEAIQQFLHFAQPQFKMGLWYILLEKYELSGDSQKCLTGLTKIFVEAMSAIKRGEPLLQTLSVAHDVGKRLMPLLERSNTILETDCTLSEVNDVLEYILKLLQMLQLFMLYDDAVNSNLLQKPVTPTWYSVQVKFRELVTLWWSIFYLYWLRSVPLEVKQNSETVNDILSIIHERLGNLGYCGIAGGALLRLHCSEIVRLNWDGSALDLTQCLRCRYGLTLTLYGEGSNHHTVPQTLEYKDARDMLPYIMRMVLSRRNFNQVIMRTDTRAVLDEFAGVIGAQWRHKYEHKRKYLEGYLASDFTPLLLHRTWQGIEYDNAVPANEDIFHGLWFVQGHILLNQYRMRRRQAYSASSVRVDNLEAATNLFLDDLSAAPSRFESWTGLAQAFTYLCEDILTFGAEIVTSADAASYCRQGLLAAAQAISLKLRGDKTITLQPEIYESLSSGLWALVGNLLVLAVLPPLSLSPFASHKAPRPFLVEVSEANKYRIAIKAQPQISAQSALSVASKCLQVSVDPQTDWINAITQTGAAKEAGEPPLKVLKYAERALELQPGSFLDAECLMVEVVWFYYRQGKISEKLARKRLAELELDVDPTLSVEDLIEISLRKLLEKDKWLHKPRYILAKMFELDRKDSVKAQAELQQLFSLKSPTKPLVIWKMESEIPGQYGVDMNRYVRYLTDLMVSNDDIVGIALLARRFRRNGLEMWNHAQAYEYIYNRACLLARKLLGCDIGHDAKVSDKLMADVVAAGTEPFETSTKAMDASTGFTDDNEWVQALYFATELRRLSNGISSGAVADDIVVTIFLSMLKKFNQEHPMIPVTQQSSELAAPVPEQSSTDSTASRTSSSKPVSKKKLVRKDVITAAIQLLKPLQQKLSKMDEIGIPKGVSVEKT